MTMTLDSISHSAAQTQRLGMRVGELLQGGELILLDTTGNGKDNLYTGTGTGYGHS